MLTVDELIPQKFEINHLKLFKFSPKLLADVVAFEGLERVPLPLTSDQVPVPWKGGGTFPKSVVLLFEIHRVWGTALVMEVAGLSSTCTVNVETVAGQTPFFMLHRKTFKPTCAAVIGVVALLTEIIFAPPLTNDQVPVFVAVGVFAVIGPDEEFVHKVELGPAMACCDN
jgi:hypothetical protein